jgi:Uncharacterised protein family (UPF0158)
MPVAWSQILEAFEFVSMSAEFGNAAWVCRETGAVHMHSDWDEELEALPEDIDDAQKYVALPTPRDLDLGRRLVMSFAAERLGDRYDDIAAIFSRKGAYRRFKDFLIRVGALEDWYAYEAEAKENALREWCAENRIELIE